MRANCDRTTACTRTQVVGIAGLVKSLLGGLVQVFGAALAGATFVPNCSLEGGDYRATMVRLHRVASYALLETLNLLVQMLVKGACFT